LSLTQSQQHGRRAAFGIFCFMFLCFQMGGLN
jgi:hypothetical protein